MKKVLQSEEIALFVACLLFFQSFGLSWWWFAGCILLPDLSMVGYLWNARTGAWLYNIIHHRAVALVIYFVGVLISEPVVQFAGFILFAHATMDRMFGYGLKYESGFQFTHLGVIGKNSDHQATTSS